MSYVYNTFQSEWLKREILTESEAVLEAVAQYIASLANRNSPYGTIGALQKSFFGVPVEYGKKVEVESRIDYASYVEFGTRPHWAPIEPLIAWVSAKVTQGEIDITIGGRSTAEAVKARKRIRMSKKKHTEREAKVRAIAHAIQRKIAAKGTDPQYMLGQALEEAGVENIQIVPTELGLEYQGNIARVIQRVHPGFWDRIAARA